MPRFRRTGLNIVRKKRHDGSVIEYFYDRATKKFLGHTREAALERLNFQDPLTEAGIVPGSISALIVDYLADEEAQSRLRASTRRLYRGYLDRMRDDWGDIAARAITRQEIMAIKKRMLGTPRKANQILSLLQILLARAKDLDVVDLTTELQVLKQALRNTVLFCHRAPLARIISRSTRDRIQCNTGSVAVRSSQKSSCVPAATARR